MHETTQDNRFFAKIKQKFLEIRYENAQVKTCMLFELLKENRSWCREDLRMTLTFNVCGASGLKKSVVN